MTCADFILFPADCFGWLQTNGTDLPAHTIDSNTHITRILSHHKAIVFIQIKHGVFDCKVHKQKRHVKVGSFRMVTLATTPRMDFHHRCMTCPSYQRSRPLSFTDKGRHTILCNLELFGGGLCCGSLSCRSLCHRGLCSSLSILL